MLANGGVFQRRKLLSPATIDRMTQVLSNRMDLTLGMEAGWAAGVVLNDDDDILRAEPANVRPFRLGRLVRLRGSGPAARDRLRLQSDGPGSRGRHPRPRALRNDLWLSVSSSQRHQISQRQSRSHCPRRLPPPARARAFAAGCDPHRSAHWRFSPPGIAGRSRPRRACGSAIAADFASSQPPSAKPQSFRNGIETAYASAGAPIIDFSMPTAARRVVSSASSAAAFAARTFASVDSTASSSCVASASSELIVAPWSRASLRFNRSFAWMPVVPS